MEGCPFTVLMVNEQTGQVTADYLHAQSGAEALRKAAFARPDSSLVAAFVGHLQEDLNIFFPGEGLVDAGSYLALWAEDPTYLLEDWREDVANGDTRRGYEDWVAAKREEESHGFTS